MKNLSIIGVILSLMMMCTSASANSDLKLEFQLRNSPEQHKCFDLLFNFDEQSVRCESRENLPAVSLDQVQHYVVTAFGQRTVFASEEAEDVLAYIHEFIVQSKQEAERQTDEAEKCIGASFPECMTSCKRQFPEDPNSSESEIKYMSCLVACLKDNCGD